MLPRKIGPSRSGVTLGNTVPPVVRHQRGTSTTDLTNMRTHDDVRGLSDEDLCKYIGGWKPGCAERIYAEAELARRLDKPAAERAWIVIAVSVAPLAVSVAAFMASIFR